MRTIVDLPAEQIEALKRISQRSRLSHAELMRQAVAEYLERHNPDREDAAFGLWQERGRGAVSSGYVMNGNHERLIGRVTE